MSPAGRAREAGTPRATRGASPAPPIPADIWVLVGAAFIVAIGYGIVAPVLPQFAESFGLGVTASSIVVSAFAFFRLVSAPAGGRFVNRFGERPVYVIGLLIVAASTFAVALSQSYWQLLLFRGLGGLGSTMFTVSAMALIVRMSPPRARARSTGLYATSFLLGNIAGPVLGGFMAGLGMRVPFIIYAVGLVIAAFVVRLKLGSAGARPATTAPVAAQGSPRGSASSAAEAPAGPAPTAPAAGGQGAAAERAGEEAPAVGAAGPTRASAAEPDRASAAGPEPGDPGGARAAEQAGASTPMRFREAWRESGYRAALFGGMANGWASMGIRVAVYPLFALHVLGVGAAEAGWALTVFALGNAVAVTSVGRFADIYGRKPFIVTGFAVLGLATIVLGYWESLTVFLVLSAVAGVGAGLLNPAQQAAVADVIGSERAGGKVLSRFQMAMDTGAIFGPIIAGWLADAFGYSIAFAASGALALLAGLFWLTARETLPPAEAPESD